jgi:hypothetical protein
MKESIDGSKTQDSRITAEKITQGFNRQIEILRQKIKRHQATIENKKVQAQKLFDEGN